MILKKQEEMVIKENKEEAAAEVDEVESEERKVKKGYKKGKILENLKNTLSDIFDETDVKM